MARKSLMVFIAGLVVCGLMFTVSCATKEIKPETGEQGTTDMTSSGGDQAAAPDQTMEDEAIQAEMQRARESFVSEDIHFDFDQSVLTPDARDILERKAAWLRRNPSASVLIEGHCDERGTAEYNIALGERRARSAMDFLVDLGISASRLSTVSYGEERPLDPRHNEAAWAKNRRAHFVIR
jgi:peptidoglycan-associated lipoprotein